VTARIVHGARDRRGFTLLETLVSITIAAVVLGALATAVRSQSRSAIFQMGTADASQNVRGALDLFKRDVRMAGFGMGAVPTATLAPVAVEAAGAGELYRLRLRGDYSVLQCGAGATLGTCTGSGALSTITLDATAAPYPTFVVGRRVAIESKIVGVAEVATITAWNPGTHVISVTPGLTNVYDAGSPVHQIDELLYVLDSQGVLRRNGDPVADQITAVGALQVRYVLADGTTTADPTASLDVLRGATLRLRSTGTTHDGLQPQADVSTEVRIRNLGIATAPVGAT
jgi:prepilin-type N-terminal cleavage/methylation domain-containing protein